MTEQIIEQELIEKLGNLKYIYREDIRDRITLEKNFREKFETLNRVHLTDAEFTRLLDQIITADIFAAARHLRDRNSFERDDGTPLFYTLVNIKDWCKNTFEVINQLWINTTNSYHRYDVILLINGIPVVQIELKTLTISPRRAIQQIIDYKNDLGNGYTKTLLCFLQLFIVSNRSDTWYFANNNNRHFKFDAEERFLPIYQFAAEDNKKITHLDSFAEKFLTKCTLGQMISRYMVLVASEQKLMIMRPYQIYAVKSIVECIHQNCGNGYIWHTTGSGKTLTSFKASTLLKEVQRLKTQLDQYTDLTTENINEIGEVISQDQLQGFRGVYLETAKRLKAEQGKDKPIREVEQLDFEFVLFASTVIDYDYIMGLIARYTQEESGRQEMTREQLIGLIQSDAKFMDEDITAYIDTLPTGEGLNETAIREGYERFKSEKNARELATIAEKHGLEAAALQGFVDGIVRRMIFDGEQLSNLLSPLELGWKARARAESALMADLIPFLHRLAQGREITGLKAYE
ncbi:hypothetical protein B7O87_03070 [Cylindrospermopsis raciborskii CENA303]|uniref:type I site-specific deoxyribonuclease n=1 Tax=Cylindrospermopsis raciborskii CENA303 TaxID=1170769 RepID=A0A1X4GB32_9CYAN|nr:type I restriction endonuclease [Cylindrospermopsis raciborskii]OSO94404.1 hypothetical protein B7O87_03070 [Cylindrospermopsis raciborskii CENA303]